MNTYLFVGGPWDGERKAIAPEYVERGRINVLVKQPLRVTRTNLEACKGSFDVARYSARSVGEFKNVLFADVGLSNIEVLGKLIKGYKP
jgi:hypothetical protein